MARVTDIWSNTILRECHEKDREELLRRLPPLQACRHPNFLSLIRFFRDVPERFYCATAFTEYFRFLEAQHAKRDRRLRRLLSEHRFDIDKGLFFLDQINRQEWHDQFETSDDLDNLRFIDSSLHTAFLRLTDGVYFPFIKLVAEISRLDRQASVEGLDLFNAVEELASSEVPNLTTFYRHIMRNGIAHGGVTFRQNEIEYRDKKGNTETHSVWQVVRFLDDLTDTCNGMSLALSLFLNINLESDYPVPQQFLVRELQAQTRSPWWRIEGCLPSQIPDGAQLLIYAKVNTSDVTKVHYYAFFTAVLAEALAAGYIRYFISLRSSKALPGFAAFDGTRLKKIRESDSVETSDYEGVLVDDLLMYVPKTRLPRILGRLDTYIEALKVNLPLAIMEVRRNLKRPEMRARAASIHRNGFFGILHGSVVISSTHGDLSSETIKRSCGRILAAARRLARKKLSLVDPVRVLPVGWARVAVFRKDYRARRLSAFGLGEDLVCTVQIEILSRVRAPDLADSTIENLGRYRIAWNKAWLESRGEETSRPTVNRCNHNDKNQAGK